MGLIFSNEGVVSVGSSEERVESKAKLLVYWSVYLPTLTYGQKVKGMTEKKKILDTNG